MSQPICAIVGFGAGVSMGVASAFGNEGYTLALLARNPAKLEANCQELLQAGYIVQPFAADAGSSESLIAAFTQIRAQLGDPEVLVYNAAVSKPGNPSAVSSEQLVSDFQVNVAGALVSVQQVLPAMRSRGKGTLLFTGGGLALTPYAEFSSLAIGKASLRSLTFSLAQELADTGIRVGTVTICGTVEPGTHFDPDMIAQSYLALHKQAPGTSEVEIVYQ